MTKDLAISSDQDDNYMMTAEYMAAVEKHLKDKLARLAQKV